MAGESAPPSYIQEGVIKVPCNAPAPAVVNGLVYLGCTLAKGHDGQHRVTIQWR